MPAAVAEEKDRIRRAVLARRDALSPEARAAAAQTIAGRGLPVAVAPGTVVAGFMPIRSEVNPLPLMRRLAEAGARLALPSIVGRGRPLVFRSWMPGEALVRVQWGIREPAPDAPAAVPALVLAPLAAFDRRGYRVGYGAGYYDMTLNALRARGGPVALGVALAMQEVEAVPTEPHDARLDWVLTEQGAIACAGA